MSWPVKQIFEEKEEEKTFQKRSWFAIKVNAVISFRENIIAQTFVRLQTRCAYGEKYINRKEAL